MEKNLKHLKRPIDIAGANNLANMVGPKYESTVSIKNFYHRNIRNHYLIFSTLPYKKIKTIIGIKNDNQKNKDSDEDKDDDGTEIIDGIGINLFKIELIHNQKSAIFFTFETLELFKIIFNTTFEENILTTEAGIKDLSYKKNKNFEEKIIQLMDDSSESYGILRIKKSKSYINTTLSHAFIYPFLDQLKVFMEVFSNKANDIHKSKLFFKLMKTLNSTMIDFISLDFDNTDLSYITDYDLLNNDIMSLDEQIIKNIAIENTFGFISPTYIEYVENSLSKNEYNSTIHLINTLDEYFSSSQIFRYKFYMDFKHSKKDNLTLLKNYFNEIPNQYLQSMIIGSDTNSDLYKPKITDDNLFDAFYNENSEFLQKLNSSLEDESIKELLKRIDDFLVTQSIETNLVNKILEEIDTSKQQNEIVSTKIKNVTNLTKTSLNQNSVKQFREQYLELLKYEQEQKEIELAKIKLNIENLISINDDDLISKINKDGISSKKISSDSLNTDIDKIIDSLYQFQKDNL